LVFDQLNIALEHHMVHKRNRSFIRVLHVYFLLFGSPNPISEFQIVWNSCWQHDDADCIRQLHDNFFPDRPSLRIVDVVYLVKNDPFDILNVLYTIVEHSLKDFSGHDKTGSVPIQLDIACNHADIAEL
jgi:hypothetical protein